MLRIFAAIVDQPVERLAEQYESTAMSQFKNELTEAIVAEICPLSTMIAELEACPDFVVEVLTEGQSRAFDTAETNLIEIKRSLGMLI